ncbi:MAG: FAD-dependent oxidoreductase [Flavobacteriaceae bacterium CG_4_8_14_3_um_filter_34_10]|nr:NAD(P)/FAD-dependent oxidoreductase [Flavobacteriia bacterium]OIP52283.1 MAG: FAD-dependent oxidoreductase [Flavobacteriaceae bacterium CG2_30_34_30]PIQ17737.1 MAG: FAD-dependent oxidoreductase [Flavobacteriaceae bacterium CG18_big_fil_WC_8_21_14_2_50_34_36]PIV51467.1 MAG: FAD-dependent oxidoreductase [Flavobacteriaceae bacterium CG02_land_8_20_14_3_00_34_13]PIX09970.1 MAG: FAD-dependent oxidoreductase [Flavobacteriaceae bacterium CG_4_8_14_3_um_filter_34_10]PIZ07743.1 MAG: FAD-dependent ox
MNANYNIIIVGGGLAGLTSALHLSKNNLSVLVIEKNAYPNHKVCGEYVSNEVLPYLASLNIYPLKHQAKQIDKLILSSKTGAYLQQQLPLGGFGISRYCLDHLLAKKVKETSTIIEETVVKINFEENLFTVITSDGASFSSQYVIGAFGKRSNMDKTLDRDFASKKSPWLAVKAHYKAAFPDDVVALHHFNGGYCGLSKVENNLVNMCYLANYNVFKTHKSIPEFEQKELSKNPFLKEFLHQAIPVFERPLTISQISFETKKPVENHILMAGDSAGLIHPLCGNGMAMAIHSAKILSEIIITFYNSKSIARESLEKEYTQKWNATFKSRLKTASVLQKMFIRPGFLYVGIQTAIRFPGIVPKIIQKTHGKTIHDLNP